MGSRLKGFRREIRWRKQFLLTAVARGGSGIRAAPRRRRQPGPRRPGSSSGSGNFFSPIVADLDKALAFYRDGLGLEVQGAPANAEANAPLRNMFGLPDAQLRWSIGRPAGMRTGVEIVEISKAGGRAVERRLQDSGAFMLIVLVRDLDAVFGRLTQLGAPVVTKGGEPIAVPSGSRARAVIVKDPGRALRRAVPARSAPRRHGHSGART